MKTFTLKHIGTVEHGTYQRISDIGMVKYVDEKIVDKDYLRMTIELNGGYHVVLYGDQHIRFASNGDIHILEYVEVAD